MEMMDKGAVRVIDIEAREMERGKGDYLPTRRIDD